MDLELIIRAVIILIIGIVAVLLVNIPKRKTLFTLGIFLAILTYFITALYFPDAASALYVVAVVVTAGAAILAISLNRQQREDTLKSEERERKEKSLNEIIEWAEAVANSAIGRQTKDPHELWRTKLEYKKYKTKGKLIGEMVSSSFKELSGSFKDINKRLDKAIEFTKQIENGKSNVESLKDYETEIAGSVEKMFKKAAKIKTRDIR